MRVAFDLVHRSRPFGSHDATKTDMTYAVIIRSSTTVLDAEQARKLLDSIDTSTVVGVRDRALISVMTFAFARIGAVVAVRVEDY